MFALRKRVFTLLNFVLSFVYLFWLKSLLDNFLIYFTVVNLGHKNAFCSYCIFRKRKLKNIVKLLNEKRVWKSLNTAKVFRYHKVV